VRILILNWKDLSHPAAGGAEVLTEQVEPIWLLDDWTQAIGT